MQKNRPLTQKEIDLAYSLDWKPTHYRAEIDRVRFSSSKYVQWYRDGELSDCYLNLNEPISTSKSPIPQKPFDIESVKWSDGEIKDIEILDNEIQVNMVDGSRPALLSKDDVINLNKALGITPEDLK